MRNVVVCWKESADAARTLGAAMPILARSDEVHIVGIAENGDDNAEGLREVVRQLRWSGIVAEDSILSEVDLPVSQACWPQRGERADPSRSIKTPEFSPDKSHSGAEGRSGSSALREVP